MHKKRIAGLILITSGVVLLNIGYCWLIGNHADFKEYKKDRLGVLSTYLSILIRSLEEIQEELDRKKKPSRGRQKVRDRPHKKLNYSDDSAIVNPISKEYYLKNE